MKEIILPFEAIVWHDASKADRRLFDPSPVILVSYGVVVHEDRKQVVLCQEHVWHEGYMGGELDYQQIPKKLILRRIRGGTITVSLERPKRRGRDAADSQGAQDHAGHEADVRA